MYRGVVEDFATDVLPLQGFAFAPSCACVVAVICEIGQPGGWRTPTTALCARRAGASRLPSDGPRQLLPTSTLARGAREAKNRHPSATMEPRSPLLRRASRGGRSPTLSPRVDRRRARVPLVSACAIRMCRGGGLPSGVLCFLPVGALTLLGDSAAPGRVAAPAFLLEIAFSCGLGKLGTGGSIWLAPRAS